MHIEGQLHADMRGREAEPFVEASGILAPAVRRELNHAATLLAGSVNGVSDECAADPATAERRVGAHPR